MAINAELKLKTYVQVSAAMLAFAANSVLCRLALLETSMDAASFTLIRLISGAATLLFILFFMRKDDLKHNNIRRQFPLLALTSTLLFSYAAAFSYAYINMDTGTGALVLFASVQLAMIGYHLVSGNRLNFKELSGLVLALAGFVYLLLPSSSSPDLMATVLMMISGTSWALFTLLGKRASSSDRGLKPIASMTYSFFGASLLSLFVLAWLWDSNSVTIIGLFFAVASGSIASALGYAIWYSVLPSISVLQASVVQLSVPALATLGGILFLGELLTLQLSLSSVAILGGIAIVFLGRKT
ncbi:DMT family transporter [Vibrio sp. HN007]|uniref:DMT family transporter n=1 Tax=Vibrio iocasae TaxID=3098914 RepID=UPI0035D4218C